MLALPPAILELLNLQAGLTVGIEIDNGRLVIQPQPRLSYSLEDLLAQCDPNSPITDQDRVWIDAKALGNEL